MHVSNQATEKLAALKSRNGLLRPLVRRSITYDFSVSIAPSIQALILADQGRACLLLRPSFDLRSMLDSSRLGGLNFPMVCLIPSCISILVNPSIPFLTRLGIYR